MITVRVFCALGAVGSRKALTPFETASTPVMAAQPLEKTLRRSQKLTIAVAAGKCGTGSSGAGCPPAANALTTPIPIMRNRQPTKR